MNWIKFRWAALKLNVIYLHSDAIWIVNQVAITLHEITLQMVYIIEWFEQIDELYYALPKWTVKCGDSFLECLMIWLLIDNIS